MEQKYTTIALPNTLTADVEAYIRKSGRYRNRTEFCIEAIRKHLRELEG